MSLDRTSLVPSVVSSRAMGRSLVVQVWSALLSEWRIRARGSPPESDYLRRDIGLPPGEPSRQWWDYR